MKKNYHAFIVIILVSSISVFAQTDTLLHKAYYSINKNELLSNLKFLSSDSLKGRGTGTIENEIAARFIAEKFKDYGLIPLGNQAGEFSKARNKKLYKEEVSIEDFFQKFSIIKSKLTAKNFLRLNFENQRSRKIISFNYKDDFIIQTRSFFNNISIRAPVVFAGYGINKGEKNYNDYVTENGKIIDVKDKIVLIVDGYPQENDPESEFSKSKNVLYRNPLKKAEVAQELGAIAVIVVSSILKNELPFYIKYKSRAIAFEKTNFSLPIQSTKSIPILFVSENVAHQIFSEIRKSLKEILETIDEKKSGQAFEFPNIMIEIDINIDKEIISTQNVVGLIEGTDEKLKNEFVIVGAHYDHVGLGYFGTMRISDTGRVHNGADDNASGTCALIELAEAFSIQKPKRSLIFIAFSGEEIGLLGSKFYSYHQPLKPLNKTVAMFNFDMIGRNELDLLWIGGAFYSDDLIKIIKRANDSTKFELLFNTGLLNFASDQAPFLRNNIPAAFFFSGLHDDYHTPDDDFDKINYEKLEKVIKLGFLSIFNLVNSDFYPAFKELSIEERKEMVDQSLQRLKKYRAIIKQEGVPEEQ